MLNRNLAVFPESGSSCRDLLHPYEADLIAALRVAGATPRACCGCRCGR